MTSPGQSDAAVGPISVRRARAASTKSSILRSAVAVMEARGFPRTRIADIAEHAGISPGLVLYHFETKEALLAAALRFSEESFLGVVEDGAEHPDNPGARLRLLLERSLSQNGPNNWLLWIDMWQVGARNEQIRRSQDELDREWRAVLVATIRDGQDSGRFRATDPEVFARTLSALHDGLAVALALRDSELTPQTALALCERLCRHELGEDIFSS